jgi:WD40 repeat protein
VVKIFKYDVVSVGFAPLCLVKCLNSGSMNLLATSDFEGNIHILDLNQIPKKTNDRLNPCFTLYSTHSKLISDMTFISMPLPEQLYKTVNTASVYLATCGLDGYLKVWDLKDNFRPIYEHFSSKKWLY